MRVESAMLWDMEQVSLTTNLTTQLSDSQFTQSPSKNKTKQNTFLILVFQLYSF